MPSVKELHKALRKYFEKISILTSLCLPLQTLSFELALWKAAGLRGEKGGEHGFHRRALLCSFPKHNMLHVGQSVPAQPPTLSPELF